MADRTVKLNITASISGLQSQMRAAKASVADFSRNSASNIARNSASIDDLSNRAGALGLGLTGLAVLAVKRFADFDKAMSSVRASTRATGGELDALRAAAVRAGADTAFSAAEAAQGIDELAKAGVSTQAILGGGLSGALNLAAAGQLSVAEAAETAASAMTQFNLDGSQVGHVADLLAAGAGKAQGSVHDMGQALGQAGLIAAQTGLSVEETTAALAAMASAGLVGSDAGTSLKTSLVALSAPSATAAEEMKRLGISAYDANGQFVGLEALAGNLQGALQDLTPAQRNAALATIFGTDALRTANVLYEQGAQGVAEWTAKVNDSGYAAETARIQTDNLTGDLERLGGSLDSVFIQSGTGANDGLRQIVQGAEAAVDALGQIPGPVLSATAAIAGSGGLALLGVAGLGKLTVGFVEAKNAATALGISTKAAGLAAGGLGAALAIGTIAFTTWAQNAAEAKARTEEFQATLDAVGRTTDATLSSINDRLSENQNDWFDNILGDDPESLIDRAQRAGLAIEDLQGYILGQADAVDRVNEATQAYVRDGLEDTATTADVSAAASRFLTGALDDEARSLTDAQKAAAQKKLADDAAGVATDGLAESSKGATGAVEGLTEAVEDQWKAMLDASDAALSLRDAQRQAEAAYDDARAALKDNGKTLDETTAKGRANQAALDAIAASGFDLVDSMRASGASSSALSDTMATTRDRFIKTAVAMGLSEKGAKRLADQLGLIPKNVTVKTDVDTATAKAQAQSLVSYINGLNATITVRERHVSSGAPGSRSGGITFDSGGYTGAGGKYEPAGIVHKDEFVVRKESRQSIEREFPGLLGALNATGANALLGGYAAGGEVSAARRDVLRKRRAVEAARAAWRRSRTERNEDRLERARDAADEARARYGRLLDEQASARTQLRRGEIRESVTSGLSGAYSAVDQLRDLADSGDFGARRERRLRGVAGDAEKALKSLYAQAERIDRRIESATNRLEKWKSIADGVSNSISGAFSLGDVTGGVNPWSGREQQATGQQLLAASLAYQAKARKLVVKLRALQEAGYGTAILQEVARQGVDGGVAMADALLSLSPNDRKALQESQSRIDFYAGRAGIAATDDQVIAAQRAVDAAEAQARVIDKNMDKWARKIGSAMARALGIKGRASGGPIYQGGAYIAGEQGRELILPQQSAYVLNANRTASLSAGPQKVVYVNVTQYYPQQIPYSKAVNKALQHAAEEVV